MKYQRKLTVNEDEDRVYFTFYPDNSEKVIVALPKPESSNQYCYAGNTFSELQQIDPAIIKAKLPVLMQQALLGHPSIALCSTTITKQLK